MNNLEGELIMKTIIRHALAAVLSIFLVQSAWAESRVWTDNFGHTITAELVENLHGEVTLQTDKGKEVHISISKLSAKDQMFVLKNTPPNFEISVSEITDRHNQGFDVGSDDRLRDDDDDDEYQIQTSHNKYKVTLSKTSTHNYDGKILAELYIIGLKQVSDEFVILDKSIVPVTMNQENNDNSFSFTSGESTTRELQGNVTAGTEYFGNLVVLVDDKGRVFETRGSRSKMEEFTAFIRKQKKGAVISKNELASIKNSPTQ